eukprot:TRINITY_DN3879_c0_g2_i1.p3 TRINITY_DN3879_c0_g2~~TRINITY_DN3879_c0_g2_i1.p3  ORF type:complete len:133 (-),score=15.47 TRINITY_DN3879_c0_g2_i1:230-628(-)
MSFRSCLFAAAASPLFLRQHATSGCSSRTQMQLGSRGWALLRVRQSQLSIADAPDSQSRCLRRYAWRHARVRVIYLLQAQSAEAQQAALAVDGSAAGSRSGRTLGTAQPQYALANRAVAVLRQAYPPLARMS